MKNINLKISNEQHHQLKTLSAFAGLSMKEFILSRVFVEAAETVFTPRHISKKIDEIENAQKAFFKEDNVIILSEEKWAKFKKEIVVD